MLKYFLFNLLDKNFVYKWKNITDNGAHKAFYWS